MYKRNPTSNKQTVNLVSRFTRRFFLTIILPIILLWGIYLLILNLYFINNTLSVQQTYLQNSLSSLQLSLSNAGYIFSSLESIPEITYYLDVYSRKREMLYSLKRTIQSQCSSLKNSNGSVESIKIYSSKPGLLYADPFYPLSNIPLSEEEVQTLMNQVPTDILWHVVSSYSTEIPDLYAYKKLYAYNYDHVIGYMELKISPEILAGYFSQFENGSFPPDTHFAVYQNQRFLYGNSDKALLPSAEAIAALPDNSIKKDYGTASYINLVRLPELNMQIILTGSLLDLSGKADHLLPSVIILIACLLFLLLFRFFLDTRDLSRQIMDFSQYIRSSDSDELNPYEVVPGAYRQQYDELLHLIRSYNDLFRENSTLISRVQKMELLNQDAMYQALQAQIHPHFIYGTLENIRMLALQNRDKEVADMIYSLSALIRQSVSISTKSVALQDELAIAAHYLKIQQYRFGERLSYRFSIEKELYDVRLPSFILQPILENSIIYGVANTFDSCALSVSAFSKNGLVEIKISNTGKTITPERLAEVNRLLKGEIKPADLKSSQNGCALYNIKERLSIFYHKQSDMFMSLTENETVTTITIQKEAAHVYHSDCG